MGRRGAMDLVAQAKEEIENLSPAAVAAEIRRTEVLLVDLREREEVDSQGTIPGAIHAPRGMLEFYADPSTPFHREQFDPRTRTILYCSWGGRSALACKTLKELGYHDAAHLDGGFKAWLGAGNSVGQASTGAAETRAR